MRLAGMTARGTCAKRPPRLFKKFNEVFWNEELGIYAYTLDGEKKPVFSLASNIGHCLWSGIVPQGTCRAGRVTG